MHSLHDVRVVLNQVPGLPDVIFKVIDAVGTLADGTRLEDATDLKRYLLKNIDIFSRGLTGMLLARLVINDGSSTTWFRQARS